MRGLTQELERGLSARARSGLADAMRSLFRNKDVSVDGNSWAEQYRYMPPGSKLKRWSTELTPYLKEIGSFLADSDPDHQVIVLSKCAQAGGSEVALNEILRTMHENPCPVLFYSESAEKAGIWLKDRYDTSVRRPPFSWHGVKTLGLTRTMPGGGKLICNGVGSQSAMSSQPARLVIGDEAARYPTNNSGISKEGDWLSLARQRTVTYGDDAKVFIISTPVDATEGEGAFPTYIISGDRRHYHCECLECGEMYVWSLEHFKKLEDDTCVMVCPSCGGMTHDGDERVASVARGRWIPTKEPTVRGMVSYELSGFVAPPAWRPWSRIFEQYDSAVKGRTSLQTFYNTVLGLPYSEESARRPEPGSLENAMTELKYKAGMLPDAVAVLTCGIDVQKDFLSIEVKGWSENLECYSIVVEKPRVSILGDLAECAREIRKVTGRKYQFADGGSLTVSLTCIDRGGFKNPAAGVDKLVRMFPQPHGSWRGGFRYIPHGAMTACHGADATEQYRLIMGEPGGTTAKGKRRTQSFWRIGVDVAKREIYQALNLMCMNREDDKDGSVFAKAHAPSDYGLDYFKELVAEQIVTRTNRYKKHVRAFVCPEGVANEALDTHVLNRVAAEVLGLPTCEDKDWVSLRGRVDRGIKKKVSPERKARIDARDAMIEQRKEAWRRKRGS